MLHDYVRVKAREIKELKIQGAKNVASAALDAIEYVVRHSKAKSLKELKKEIAENARYLMKTRPTEPQLRDAMVYAIRSTNGLPEDLSQAKRVLYERLVKYEDEYKRMEEKIAEIGARKIPDDATIITHCHSSTLMAVLRRATDLGKSITLMVTETRPRYQGLKTALEARKMGLKVIYFVDSAAYYFMRKADLFMTGADAITSDGYVINKIGTALMALAAEKFGVPYYVTASTLKYDPSTLLGKNEPIEERDPSEVIDPRILRGVEIRNPAFDATPPEYVDGVITEVGIFLPQVLPLVVTEKKLISPLEEVISKSKAGD